MEHLHHSAAAVAAVLDRRLPLEALDELDSAYAVFERRVLIDGGHRYCSFATHARTCYEEGFVAGYLAALRLEKEEG